MEAKFTPGKLKTSYTHLRHVLTDGGFVLAVCSADPGLTTTQANARRIVACWNACEGLYTESLERNEPLAAQIVKSANAAHIAAQQRDELLEALVDLVALYPLDSTDAIITSARAAIAKATGETP
jgi:hypothetical protein